MERRIFLTVAGALMSAPATERLLAPPVPSLTRTGKSRHVSISTVDELDTMNASLRRLDDGGGGAALLTMVRAHLHQVVGLIEHSRYTETVARRLYSNAGELLRLAGWLAFDAGQQSRAQRLWFGALRAAHTAGDHALAANALGFMSCQAKDIRQPGEAVTLAEAARRGYRGASPRVSAILALRAAEAHAADGSMTVCRRAIDDAFAHLNSPITAAPDWSYWLDLGHAHGQAGFCYLKLGHHASARRHFRQALSLQDPSAAREGALRCTLLATTYVRQKDQDLDQALALAGQAVDVLADDISSNRCVGHLNTLLRDLAPYHRRSGVRDLAERVRSLQRASASEAEAPVR